MAQRFVEETARGALARGAPARFIPTVGLHGSGPFLLLQALLAAAAGVAGLHWPMASALLILALAVAAVRDLQGGRGWLRGLLPRQPGWVADILVPGPASDRAPTLLLWIPGPRPGADPRLQELGQRIADPLLMGGLFLLLIGDVLFGTGRPQLGTPALGLGSILLFLTLLTALPGLLAQRLRPPDGRPPAWLPELLEALRQKPLRSVKLRVAAGSLGCAWHDDLEVFLRNRRAPLDRASCLVLAVQPGKGPMGLVIQDGPLDRPERNARLHAALGPAGLPAIPGRTGARRARRLGFRAIGLQGGDSPAQEQARSIEAALRCLDAMHVPAPDGP